MVADVSMSLDNVLAVAGAAQDHPVILVFGLGLSIALMGIAASFIARLLQKHHWIAYVGLAVILYVAVEMVYRGALMSAACGDAVTVVAMTGQGLSVFGNRANRPACERPASRPDVLTIGGGASSYLARGAFAGVTAASTVGRRALNGAKVSWASLV